MHEALMFEEVSPPIEANKPWDRQENEPARWFLRFRRYLAAGHTRSVNAIYEAERQEKAEKSRNNRAGETWYQAARRYQWKERAAAYDDEVQEQKAATMRQLAAQSPFISRPYRLMQLNSLADGVARLIEQGQPPEVFLPLCKQLQALMHDIASEVSTWDAPIDVTCDASALDATIAKMQRLRAAQLEYEQSQDARMAAAARELREALLKE